MWLVPVQDLSADQATAVGQDFSRNRVVVGGPGAGKTLVLAHRANVLIRERQLARDRVRLLVYTKMLREYIAVGLADLRLDDICSTFDKWVSDELADLGLPYPRVKYPWAPARRKLRSYLETHPGPHRWDALLVDEGQDLDADALAILELSAAHVTLAMDDRQQLYETGTDVAAACKALGARRASAHLLSAFRCTPDIVRVAAEFLPTPELRRQFRESNLMPIGEKETPVITTFATPAEELDALAEALRERAFAGQTSAVLLTDKSRLKRVIAGLKERKLDVRTKEDSSAGPSAPLVVTYHSAKGLTVQSVFLPRLTGSSFRKYETDQLQRLLFVGVTRATHWLWLGTVDPEPKFLAPVRKLTREGVLSDGNRMASQVHEPVPPVQDDDDNDDDDLMGLI